MVQSINSGVAASLYTVTMVCTPLTGLPPIILHLLMAFRCGCRDIEGDSDVATPRRTLLRGSSPSDELSERHSRQPETLASPCGSRIGLATYRLPGESETLVAC